MSTFLFADLVGYTALSVEQGDEHAAEVATRFQREVRALAARHGATVVKSLGDGASSGDALSAVSPEAGGATLEMCDSHVEAS